MNDPDTLEGILLVNKAKGKTSFSLVSLLRRLTKIRKIGFAGTLDPFATGLMVMLIGRKYTSFSEKLSLSDKEYDAILHLGSVTETFDSESPIQKISESIPTLFEISSVLSTFQGHVEQIPPMFSAKKVAGRKLYELARKGITIERKPIPIFLNTKLIEYSYPYLHLHISCSKGTYIRSIANDIGKALGCGAYLSGLTRVRCGDFSLSESIDQTILSTEEINIKNYLKSL